jgi:hypothetical protein
LDHAVSDRRYSERSLPASRLRYHDPAYRRGPVLSGAQLLPQSDQPLLQSLRLDVFEALPVHAWSTARRSSESVGVGENVFSVHLVVELVKATGRLRLRCRVQLPLEIPDRCRSCQAHRANLLVLVSLRSTLK